jgi:hypothetical protein
LINVIAERTCHAKLRWSTTAASATTVHALDHAASVSVRSASRGLGIFTKKLHASALSAKHLEE